MPILLIEDDANLREGTRALLEANGYTVVAVADGAQGLRHLRDGLTPGLIVLDLRMPVMDGTAFRIEQTVDPRFRNIPVVVLSGDGAVGRSSIFRGVAHYRKPLEGDELIRVVGEHAVSGDEPPAMASPAPEDASARAPHRHREVRGRPLLRGRSRRRRR